MKKYTTLLCLLLALVMVMACFTGCAKQPAQSDPADTTEPAQTTDTTPEDSTPAEPTDTRETVNIRFAQFGNNLDDLDGYANDPIKAAIEQAVGVTLEYDTGTDGFDDRMQTSSSPAAPPICSRPGARATRSPAGCRTASSPTSARSSTPIPPAIPRSTR